MCLFIFMTLLWMSIKLSSFYRGLKGLFKVTELVNAKLFPFQRSPRSRHRQPPFRARSAHALCSWNTPMFVCMRNVSLCMGSGGDMDVEC